MTWHVRFASSAFAAVVIVGCWAEISSAQEKVAYNRDVRPILSNNCFLCHGRDEKNRKAKLRLDVRESAMKPGKTGRAPIVPGKPDESELVRRIFTDDDAELMPPPKAHKKLSTKEKETLRRWIAEGAEYQDHWAYITPKRPDLPPAQRKDWIRTPIDAFILAELEARQIIPSPEADKRTLLRRLNLDLIGLPPTSDELRAFLDDTKPGAYERQVHRLLDSPHFGERMALPWLDVVRFADTVGYHGDQNQRIFPYRDYVIDSFNRNKPFDQFTLEQLAGDLLPKPTTEQLVATGFNRLNMMTREGGAQPMEYLARYEADRVRTVGMAWLGSTLGCCECHDHKYDPFTMRDFYSLAAFFADLKQWGVYQDYDYTPNPELRGWSNDHPFPPEIEVDNPYLRQRQERLRREINGVWATAAKKLEGDRSQEAFEKWLASCHEFLAHAPSGWHVPPAAPANPKIAIEKDGSLLFPSDLKRGGSESIELRPGSGWIASVRLELLPHKNHKETISRDGATPFVQLSAALKSDKSKNPTSLAFFFADANFKEERYANGFPLLGVTHGWKTSAKHLKEVQTSVWLLEKPIQLAADDRLIITLKGDHVGYVRIAVSPFFFEDPRNPQVPAELAAAMTLGTDACSADQKSSLAKAFFSGTAYDPAACAHVQKLLKEIYECSGGRAFTMVAQAREPAITRVLPRGNWQDETGPVVQPTVPRFLPQSGASTKPARLTRLDLAHWLTSPENPLTARVIMNRLWKQFFGAGLCGSIEDLGAQGESPTHPELLDWLAVEFRESGWNVKHMVELMVLSSTYRQSSKLRSELREIDPNNRLLASQSPRRLEAEFVRDNALTIAGLLNLDIGGPSVHPYQPAGYYVNLQFPDRDYIADTDDRQYRRGLYMHWQRTFLQPMLANFDAPSREECIANRNAANTPQQALTLLNDPTFVEAARVFAQRLLRHRTATDAQRVEEAYEKTLCRPPREKERDSLLAFLAEQRSYYHANPDDAKKLEHAGMAPRPADIDVAELAAWTNLCRVILNLHETITRY
jgi:hypothetical protein